MTDVAGIRRDAGAGLGIASAALLLDEAVHATDVAGGVLVVGGVLAGVLGRARPVDTPEPAGRALDKVAA